MPTLRLATAVVNRNDQMSKTVTAKGQAFHFDSRDRRQAHTEQSQNSEDDGLQDPDLASMELDHESEGTIKTRYLKSHLDLEDVVHENENVREPG